MYRILNNIVKIFEKIQTYADILRDTQWTANSFFYL